MIRPSVFRVALALLAALPAVAQEIIPATPPPPAPTPTVAVPPLTLEECVARALNKNFDLQLQQFTTRNARESVIVADAFYDPTLFSTAALAGRKTSSGDSFHDQSLRVGVSQRLETGAQLAVSTALNRNKTEPRVFNPVYNSDVAFSVSQPLLQGFGLTINRAAIERARLGVVRANYDYKSVVLALIRDVEAAYYNLAFAREQLAVRATSLEVAQTLLDENSARLDTGVATSLDVLQSDVGVANARRNLLLARQSVTDREDDLLELIGRFEFDSSLGPVRLPDTPADPEISFEHSYRLALANSPDYAARRVVAEQLQLDVEVAKNNRLPSVDLGAAVGLNGDRRDTAGGAFRSASSGDAYNWQVDLTVSIPWGLRAERARYRQALNNLNRQETFIQQLDQTLLLQVRSAVRAAETNRETVAVSALATRLSEQQFETEKARYEAGLSTYRFVEDSRRDLDTARVNELLAKVNFRIALAELSRLEGTSLDRYQVTFED